MAATWKQSITTSAGIALMNKAYGVSSIIPTKAVTITDDISGLSVTQVMALTSVNYNQSRVPIVISNQANTTRIGIDIDNKDVNEQYDYYGIGVYFKQVNTGEEVLFSVIPLSGAATIIPNQSGVATSSISIDSYTSIVPGTNIDLTVSDSGSVTRADVEQIVAANQSFSFPKNPLATGIDLQSIKSIGIYQINDDKTVVNAPDSFSGNGYLIVVGDGTTANPIVQEITDTVTGNKSINVYNSSLNKWDGWQKFSYKSYVDDSIKSANEHTDNGLATKADTSAIDQSVMIKNTLTANDDVLALDPGTYYTWGVKPNNFPATLVSWSTVVVKTVGNQPMDGKNVTITDTNASQLVNTYSGNPPTGKWSGWRVPNSTSMASKSDLSTGLATKADDSKVVHTSDMRKAPNDVAGIEEVNAKQDKLTITPADDSTVVHTADMRKPASDVVGLEDVPNGLYKGSLAQNTDLDTLTQEGIYNFSTSLVNFLDSDKHWGTIQITNKSALITQYVISSSNLGDQIFFRTKSGTPATWYPWTMVPRFSMDNSLKLPSGGYLKPADDSKVAHLSGANDFDTVPTVNHNPLLLASSLPSDLARTSQQTNFTAGLQSNGLDVLGVKVLSNTDDYKTFAAAHPNALTIVTNDTSKN